MSTRDEKIKLEVAGAQQSARDLDKVGDAALKAGESTAIMGEQAGKAAKGVDELGDQAKQTGQELTRLDRQILATKAAVKSLNDEYERDGGEKVLDNLRRQQVELSKLQSVQTGVHKIRLAEAAEAAKADEARARSLAATLLEGGSAKERAGGIRGVLGLIGGSGKSLATAGANAVGGAFSDIPGSSLVKTGLAVGAAPLLGGVAGGALLAGAGAGIAGAGVAGAIAGDPAKFKAAWSDAISGITGRWKAASSNEFEQPTLNAIKTIKGALHDIDIEGPLKAGAKYVEPLVRGVTGFAKEFAAGLGSLTEKAGPTIEVLSKDLPLIGKAFKQAFDEIGNSSEGATTALDDTLQFVGLTVVGVGKLVAFLSDAYQVLHNIHGDITGLFGVFEQKPVTETLARTLDSAAASTSHYVDVEKLLGDAARSASDALRDQLGIMLSVDEATDRASEATDKLKETLKQNHYEIDGNSKAARENRDVMRETVRTWEDERDAAIAAGKGTRESIDQANAKLLGHLEDLRAVLVAHGKNTEAVDAYILEVKKAMGLVIPDQYIKIHYDTSGLPKNLGSRYGGTDQYASGGPVRRTGLALVGEGGPEFVQLSQGDYVHNASDTARIRASGGGGGGGASAGGGPPVVRIVLEYPDGRVIRDELVSTSANQGRTVGQFLGI